jgi:vitamin B12/bleomycin/antimicrobial peptide transport system ATP-binding/permease protein
MSSEAVHEEAADTDRQPGFFRQFVRLAGGYWTAPGVRWQAIGLTAGLIILGVAQVGMAIWLNYWNKDFFDALERKDWAAFLRQVGVLAAIVVVSALTVATHLHVKRRLQYGWRRWLSARLIEAWLRDGRQYLLQFMPDAPDNPDGRIAEDVRIATEFAVEFAQSILHCVMLLTSFLTILWGLSGTVHIGIAGVSVAIPGHMVWLAIAYAAVGSALTFSLGRPLVRMTDQRQAREADFRVGLVRARENAEGVALMRGETDERRRLFDAFAGIRMAWLGQTRSQGRLMLLTYAYGTLAGVFPLIVAAPRYFAGSIGLGGLMQISQAFLQVQTALSWFVDNFPRFAEWRASAERVVNLHEALDILEEDIASSDENTIVIITGDQPLLKLRGLIIAHPDGTILVSEANTEFKPGERALIKGESGSGKSTLFRAVASLWPWGRGVIELPPDAKLMFMPQQPYLPVGPLRAVLLYPMRGDSQPEAALRAALAKVGLEELGQRLDEEAQWDHVLSGGEQQRVAFARLLLQRPDWIFLDEATAALDEANQERMMRLLIEELPEAAVLNVGHRPGLEAFHQRELVLVRGEEGARLLRASHARRLARKAREEAEKQERLNLIRRWRKRLARRAAEATPR